MVERARIIWLASQGWRVPAIAADLRLNEQTERLWLTRFNATRLDGLRDVPHSGCPPTYSRVQVGDVIVTALTSPRCLDLPFASWTLDRLTAYLNEEKGIPINRRRIDELLIEEGVRWRTQETWFGERVDPEFAKKRGSSTPFIPTRLRIVPSCAWTRWVPRRPRAIPAVK